MLVALSISYALLGVVMEASIYLDVYYRTSNFNHVVSLEAVYEWLREKGNARIPLKVHPDSLFADIGVSHPLNRLLERCQEIGKLPRHWGVE